MMYRILYAICAAAMRLWHPVFRVTGRENVLREGNMVICPNHCGYADPIWVLLALHLDTFPRIMAKASLMKVPLLGAFLRKCNVFGVRRGEHDIAAVKEGLRALQAGEDLLLFPEGTRVKNGKRVAAKTGAVMFALRTDTPILPVYIETKRFPFSPMRCVIGEAYRLPQEDRHAQHDTLCRYAAELQEKIYALGERR